MNRLRQQAEILRAKGYSYSLINKKLGIPKSTMSYWFKDKPFVPNSEVSERIKHGQGRIGLERHNRRILDIEELRKQGSNEIGELSERDIWMLGLGLYIGEGAKTTENIRISNSNPSIIRFSIKWLKEVFHLSDENLVIRLHLYPDSQLSECLSFWKQVTGLSEKNFRKPSIDLRVNKKINKVGKLPYGTAHVSVKSNGDPLKGVYLYRKLNGWIEGAMNQSL